MNILSTMGFNPFFRKQINTDITVVARIAAEHRGGYQIWSEAGTGFAKLAGKLTQYLEADVFPGVGDWVTLRGVPTRGETAIIESVLERTTLFTRGAAGRKAAGQIIAANVDVVFIVCGLDSDFNVRRIERYLARVFASGAQPIVVLNKSDICNNVHAYEGDVQRASPGVDVIVVSARNRDGIEAIQAFISHGVTAAFVGSSGAGKSTLINAILGDARMETREVRASDGRGVHTTTHRQLFMLETGGVVIDTPGMRELQLFDDEGIHAAFADIEALSTECRFADCSHISEPGCAVRNAVETGYLFEERLDNYMKLQKEAAAYELRHDAHKRKKVARDWGQIVREGRRIRKWKGNG